MTTRRNFMSHSATLAAIAAAAGLTTPNLANAQQAKAPSGSSQQTGWQQDQDGAMTKNVERVAYHSFDKGGVGYQMAMQEVDGRIYLYCAHWWKNGISIFDVTDPAKFKFIKYVPEPSGNNGFAMVKLQIADGIGITHMQPRAIDLFFGPQPKDVKFDEGLLIWDFKDPENPKVLSHWHTGSVAGTHRNFYNGGRYIHLASAHPDYLGDIYRILDIQNPSKPVEVGQWAHPDQGPPDPNHHGMPPYFNHMPYIEGDRAYLAYAGVGMVILDISDITKPKYLGALKTDSLFGGGAGGASVHTCLPLSGSKPLALVTTEGERPFVLSPDRLKDAVHPMNMIGIAHIGDPTKPALLSICPIPTPPPGSEWGDDYVTLDGLNYPFGPHNIHQPGGLSILEDRSDRVYSTYFQGGLRVYDVSNEYAPKEIAAYCPAAPKDWNWERHGGGFPGPLTTCAEDLIVDRRGYIYMTNSQGGLYILKVTV